MRTLTQPEEHTDTEITLGMTSLLGIFFGLVLICGVFFGLGYSLGRHPAPEGANASAAITPTADDASAATAARAKPSAQQALQVADSSLPAMPAESNAAETPAEGTTSTNAHPAAIPVAQTQPAPRAQLKPAVVTPATPALQASSARPAPPVPMPATLSTAVATPTMVQIAAVSRQEDADVLVSALRTHGFNVAVRNESQDKLLHIQVGPFSTREQARAMRQKLLDAGYNAILKP